MPKTDDPQPSTSSQIQPPQESAKNNTNESKSDKKGNLPKTHLRLLMRIAVLLQTKDTRLSEELNVLRVEKSPKLDNVRELPKFM